MYPMGCGIQHNFCCFRWGVGHQENKNPGNVRKRDYTYLKKSMDKFTKILREFRDMVKIEAKTCWSGPVNFQLFLVLRMLHVRMLLIALKGDMLNLSTYSQPFDDTIHLSIAPLVQ